MIQCFVLFLWVISLSFLVFSFKLAWSRNWLSCLRNPHFPIFLSYSAIILWSKSSINSARLFCITFSIKPRTPDFEGLEHFPPSVCIMSTPSCSNSSASLTCSPFKKNISAQNMIVLSFHNRRVLLVTWSGRLRVWGTVTDNVTDGRILLVSFVRFNICTSFFYN